MRLALVDSFKEQDNNGLRELCTKNNFEIVIVPHNLPNKF